MMVLKSCKQQSCTHPWETLHPAGNVKNLLGALSSAYDDFYSDQAKVSFTRCEGGYIVESEGPQDFHVFATAGELGEDDDIYNLPWQQVLINPDWSQWE
jgi:N-acetylglucosamine-6-sulfatase